MFICMAVILKPLYRNSVRNRQSFLFFGFNLVNSCITNTGNKYNLGDLFIGLLLFHVFAAILSELERLRPFIFRPGATDRIIVTIRETEEWDECILCPFNKQGFWGG